MTITIMENSMLQHKEAEAMKRSAFFGITVSTMATLTAIIAIPLLYNYMQHIQSSLEGEIQYCKHLTDGLWQQYDKMQILIDNENTRINDRLKRHVIRRNIDQQKNAKNQQIEVPARDDTTTVTYSNEDDDDDDDDADDDDDDDDDDMISDEEEDEEEEEEEKENHQKYTAKIKEISQNKAYNNYYRNDKNNMNENNGSKLAKTSRNNVVAKTGIPETTMGKIHNNGKMCCNCGTGAPGPPGPPGPDGDDGIDGLPGTGGLPGKDAESDAIPKLEDFCFDCPSGQPGPVGDPGPKGLPGPAGMQGSSVRSLLPGPPGPPGLPGPKGRPGPQGQRGMRGKPGIIRKYLGIKGPPGPLGPRGPPGNIGQPGIIGKPGPVGPIGLSGSPGLMGKPGMNGLNGNPGSIGKPGKRGSCSHCPIPRTSPGF